MKIGVKPARSEVRMLRQIGKSALPQWRSDSGAGPDFFEEKPEIHSGGAAFEHSKDFRDGGGGSRTKDLQADEAALL
jgi:hypothetical protein